ncbi:MAG: hypothetical protein ACTHNU_00615 [Gaiellales bacterium]
MARPLVIVDAENVRRSRWPNLSTEDLVERTRAWADEQGVDLLIVFDGAPPEDAPDLLRAEKGETADDRIADVAAGLTAAERPYWLVTSDRELRVRAGAGAARVLGGGSFLAGLAG